MKTTRAPASGFTLVELLVVIGIISILASLLLPALGRAMESARGISCANSQRQVGLMFTLYSGDFSYYPPLKEPTAAERAAGSVANTYASPDWRDCLVSAGHIEHKAEISTTPGYDWASWRTHIRLYCPSSREAGPVSIGSGSYYGHSYAYPSSSSTKPGIGGSNRSPYPRTKPSQVRNPSQTCGLLESTNGERHSYVPWYKTEHVRIDVHQGAANYWFADGHVERVRDSTVMGSGSFPWDALIWVGYTGPAAW